MRDIQSQLQEKQNAIGQLGPIAIAIIITALLLALLTVWMDMPAAAAGNNLQIEAIAIDLKPEYDARDVLVAYSVQVANKGSQPGSTQITLPVPAGARLKGVFEMTGNGAPEIPGASIQGSDDTAAVSFATPTVKPGESTTVYAMYHWNGVKFNGRQRTVAFSFQAPFSVPAAVLKVTEPAGSSDMVITPAPAFRMGEDTPISIIPLENLQAGQTITLNLTYNKAGGQGASKNGIILVTLGALMVAGLGFLLWRGAAASRGLQKGA